ncbi:hypothetical protein CLAFUW4_13225 [Fulvia fulva]|uniref:Uncharacterized protein n=1 Tax=Passalora fulva TaxID=5499 RepID=A0A9Q8PKB9_PASFU|nr:uncharacterized protein CLAFUR5_13081 [Fulvia fulva]KAK4611515.1 hypothetical protein CLAFUR4_13230 [Fulvia fulva]KAK4612976.1 hypothetical protein CLAFUR0_13235 [Fulvia fulva]UJO23959.1 hypothetical protein CLAFUR5_13081 [Fulvia fulva]WPV21551.1 hypothetical protein CLAFUW4_13225 [Fulvia fulva]WPV35852.1 hypothetical protein CLAFUW7_13232 [Fulvia fulva]
MTAPFHRLLAFYSNRNQDDTQTIRLQDSLRGNLALGLDFPVALGIAVGRHLFLKNTGLFSLNIHVPSVSWKETPLHGVEVDEKKEYTMSEVMGMAREKKGPFGAVDGMGVWSLAADVKTGLVKGEDIVGFQEGRLFERIEKRRKDRNQVLPLWRGGPISVTGHSWMVKKMFGVNVYRDDDKDD